MVGVPQSHCIISNLSLCCLTTLKLIRLTRLHLTSPQGCKSPPDTRCERNEIPRIVLYISRHIYYLWLSHCSRPVSGHLAGLTILTTRQVLTDTNDPGGFHSSAPIKRIYCDCLGPAWCYICIPIFMTHNCWLEHRLEWVESMTTT